MDIANSALLSKSLPCENQADLTFSDPWEARVFSIIVSLSQAGHFTWGEWVETFAREVAASSGVRPDTDSPCGLSVACRTTAASGRWHPADAAPSLTNGTRWPLSARRVLSGSTHSLSCRPRHHHP